MSAPNSTIKFLCSYNGKILPRYPDGKLRYHGGQTRLLSVDRSISFSDLLVKLGDLCGSSSSASVTVRCQLPTEDLDALVTVTSDEDLVNLIEVYDRESTRQSKSLKIKAFLKISATGSSSSAGSPKSPLAAANRCFYHLSKAPVTPQYIKSAGAGKVNCYAYGYGNPSRSYLVHNGNYWQ
ncbi:RAF-like serine/threonine-protein kinase PRAF [Bidens hawaiensis]|uniref:RAF-like serine/threonine-protein kinase PRAF n=1 Tax=Bidens hawaiensis TaxID=980011 RepID=UPI00404ADAC8